MIKVIVADTCKKHVKEIAAEVQKNCSYQLVHICVQCSELRQLLKDSKFDLLILSEENAEFRAVLDDEIFRTNKRSFDLLLISRSCDKDLLQKSLSMGVVDYLIQPYPIERLKISLENYRYRFEALRKTELFSQNSIDRMVLLLPLNKKKTTLKKGITEETRNRIWQCIIKKGGPMEIKELEKEVGISGGVIRKYLQDMFANELINMRRIDGQVGRPRMIVWPSPQSKGSF